MAISSNFFPSLSTSPKYSFSQTTIFRPLVVSSDLIQTIKVSLRPWPPTMTNMDECFAPLCQESKDFVFQHVCQSGMKMVRGVIYEKLPHATNSLDQRVKLPFVNLSPPHHIEVVRLSSSYPERSRLLDRYQRRIPCLRIFSRQYCEAARPQGLAHTPLLGERNAQTANPILAGLSERAVSL